MVSLSLLLASVSAQSNAAEVTTGFIDISRFEPTFIEDFNDGLDVSPWGEPRSRWIAHTPWNGDFGDAKFVDPEVGFPFTVEAGILRIEARKDKKGAWSSGLISSIDAKGRGFAQDGGYFEARMKVPPGAGTWPAFWLIGADRRVITAEIDVMEHYGHWPDRFTSSRHVWRRQNGAENDSNHQRTVLDDGVLADSFHQYGVEIQAEELVFYFNRWEVWRIPKPDEFDGQKFYPLVNLALGSGWPIDDTPSPSYLYVDYVHVWRPIDR